MGLATQQVTSITWFHHGFRMVIVGTNMVVDKLKCVNNSFLRHMKYKIVSHHVVMHLRSVHVVSLYTVSIVYNLASK